MALALMLQAFYLALFPSDTFAATPPKVNAPIALAVDAATGRILYSKDANRRTAMASTTKIMTALTAMSVPGVNLNEKYTVVKSDLVGEAAMGLVEGDVVTFQDLLFGMLINSGNDAATAVARYAGSKLPGQGDPVARFIQQMNTKASEYGLRNTHYSNPHGLDQAGHYSSAFDLAITGWYLLKEPTLSQIVQVSTAVRAGKNLQNLNRFLKNYQGATGIKPGETDNAGLCLVGSATRNNKTVITVILKDDFAGYNADPITLSDFAFAELNNPTLAAGGGAAKAEYIGKVSGNKLIVDQIANVGGNPLQVIGNNPEVLNAPINAQVVTTAPPTTRTAAPTFQQSTGNLITVRPDVTSNQTESPQTNATPGGNDNDSSKKKDAGVSLPLILFVILVILGGVWLAARMGYIAGDRGRDMAYTVQDGLVAGARWLWHWTRKLMVQLKPGHHDEEPKSREIPKGVPAQANRLQSNNYRTRVQATPTRPATRNDSRPVVEDYHPAPENVTRRPSSGEYTFTDNTRPTSQRPNMAQPIGRNPVVPNNLTKPNPLDNFFDDVPPFQVDPHSEPQGDSSLRPPAPLGQPRPAAYQNHPNRTAAEPHQTPEEPYKARIPAPLSSAPLRPNPAPAPVSNQPVPNAWGAENITMRARQAIDYAYAGRLQASTDEFRKVIETNPLFDFGSIDEFEQMPVMGFKALATAYHSSGKTKYAMLLLDMAVEKYPNDLELRNLFRSMRREMGA